MRFAERVTSSKGKAIAPPAARIGSKKRRRMPENPAKRAPSAKPPVRKIKRRDASKPAANAPPT